MSISDHGSETLAWVCRCSIGLRSASSPEIHILAGENVCIHAMTPTQASVAVASRHARRMASAVVSTGFQTIRTGIWSAASRLRTISCDWSATSCNVSSP